MIKVLSKGFASLQDLGRLGHRQKGIPYAGVMDQDAYQLCNALLSNVDNTPVIEYFNIGLKIQALKDFSCCIIGQVTGISINGKTAKSGQILILKKGDVLDTGRVAGGTFAYLGIAGVYRGDSVLGSSSESLNILSQGIDNLAFEPRVITNTMSRLSPKFLTENPTIIDCFQGPEWSKHLTEVKKELIEKTYHLSRETWRMAFKLQEKIPNKISGISSSPVMPGTVQLTPKGDVMILMRDAQTTGGYPRILQLSDDAINKLCRVGWGGKIKFNVYL